MKDSHVVDVIIASGGLMGRVGVISGVVEPLGEETPFVRKLFSMNILLYFIRQLVKKRYR